MSQAPAALYGIENSNRSGDELWSKNRFNSTFPVALACYMRDRGIKPVYISLNGAMEHVAEDDRITFGDVFGLRGRGARIKFDFEAQFEPFHRYCYDSLPSIDLATRTPAGTYKRPIEVKLTVLPDNSTAHLPPDRWSSELVLRPVTSAYATLSLIDSVMRQDTSLKNRIRNLVEPTATSIQDWSNIAEIRSKRDSILGSLGQALETMRLHQKPYLLQPIWKTEAKTPLLAQQCFDIFVWSDVALLKAYMDAAETDNSSGVGRALRECARTLRCINGIVVAGRISYEEVYAGMPLGNLNDKSASFNGRVTLRYMQHPRLQRPAIKRDALRRIILNHGERMLSPERRFDATIFFTCQELLQ